MGRWKGLAGLLVAVAAAAHGGPAPGAEPWRPAGEPRQWAFPRDHGAHPDHATEWWYVTGNLRDGQGRPYGYQLTVFRVGVRRRPPRPDNPWSLRDLFLGHFAVTDGARGRFRFAEQLSRAGPGLAGASTQGLDAWVLGWRIRMEAGRIRLRARTEAMEVELSLEPRKPVVLHGRQGVSRKGPRPGQASYYASFTDLATRGWIRVEPGGDRIPVEGRSWFDQEFGSNQLAEDQAGWDWFGLHLSDGRDLMVYLLRKTDGSVEPASSGTLVEADGASRHLPLGEIRVEVLDRWKSPHSGARYPSRWRLQIPSAEIDLTLAPLVADQELRTRGTAGVTYWERAVEGEGTSRGRPVACEGYVELTGYAGSLGGLF